MYLHSQEVDSHDKGGEEEEEALFVTYSHTQCSIRSERGPTPGLNQSQGQGH